MRNLGRHLGKAAFLVGLAAFGGMACHSPAPRLAPPAPPPRQPVLSAIPRQLTKPDVQQASTTVAVESPVEYRKLTPDECRRLACQHAGPAQLILEAAQRPKSGPSLAGTSKVDSLRWTAAQQLSKEARNQSAGAALELYYRLQEAELLSDMVTQSLTELDDILASAQTLASNGYPETPETLTLKKTQIELRSEKVKVLAGIRRLNNELKILIGAEATQAHLLPDEGITVIRDQLDGRSAALRAFQSRGDLQALRTLEAGLDQQTLDAVKQAIAGLLPPLGAITAATNTLAPGLRALLPFLDRADVETVRRQLCLAIQERERDIAKDVATAIDDYHTQYERIGVSRQLVVLLQKRIEDLQTKLNNGLPVEGEFRQARLDLIRAEREQLRDTYAWKQADIAIRKHLGVLCCD
ncbi:MAG: TolC family protein [Fimbriiglobus sp.]